MKERPRTIELPDAFNINIGKIVVAHAALEQRLRDIVYECAGIDQKKGRVLRIARRLASYPELVKELLLAVDKDIALSKPEAWSHSLQEGLATADDERNRLAHGIWVKDPAHPVPVLQVVEKAWTQPDGKKALAKINPRGWVLGDEYLPSVLEHYRVCFWAVDQFHDKVRAILAS